MSQQSLDDNLNFFNEKLGELLKDPAYAQKFVVINNKKITAVFDTFSSALEFAISNYTQGEFVIQQVLDKSDQINFLRSAV